MINLTKHSVNGKISVKSLVKTFDEYQAKEKELANKMFHLRGVFPRPEEYIELRNEMAQVKTTLSDLRNCLKIYCRYGNINGKEVINKMLDSGHSIGNHTASHLSMPSLASKENFSKYLEEIISVEDTFKEVTGREIDKIYREPRGEFSKRSLNIMKDLGYSTYFWSSAYKDWDDKLTKEEALTYMIERVHNGAIFLLHPTSKGNYLALENFIKTMKEKGYTFDLVKNI